MGVLLIHVSVLLSKLFAAKQQQGPGPIKMSQLPPHYRDLARQRIVQSQGALQQQQHQQQHLPPINSIQTSSNVANMMALASQQQQVQQLTQMLSNTQMQLGHGHQLHSQQQQQQQQQQQLTNDAYIRAQLELINMEKMKLAQKQEEIARKVDRKSTRLNSSHKTESRMPSSA